MDPITLIVLVAVVVALVGSALLFVMIRAWLRTIAKLVKVVVYLGLFCVVAGAVGAAVFAIAYPEQVAAMLSMAQ